MEPAARFQSGSKRTGALVALAALAVLGAVLVVDLVTLPGHWKLPRPFRAAGFEEVAGAQSRARTLSVIVAIAARDLSDGVVESLVVPEDRDDLVNVKPDRFAGADQQTIDPRLIDPFVGGAATVAKYDARVGAATIQRWKIAGRLVAYPKGVFGVRPDEPAMRFVLYADTGRSTLYVVPEGLAGTIPSGGTP
ncbi:MAG: hypothetical protein Q8K99_05330 [Actinomycetota bacterium]|nr:hypothetical protein [Actinomycetota bacterium]